MRRIVHRVANSPKRSVRTNQSQVFISYSRNDISEGRSMTATAVAEFVRLLGALATNLQSRFRSLWRLAADHQTAIENDSSR